MRAVSVVYVLIMMLVCFYICIAFNYLLVDKTVITDNVYYVVHLKTDTVIFSRSESVFGRNTRLFHSSPLTWL